MYGDTITVTVNAVAKAMSKINQDSYSSEYFLKESLGEFRLRIRHSKDRVSASSKPRDRHTVTFTETVYATVSAPQFDRQSTITVVGNFDDVAATQAYNVVGLEAWLNQANAVKLVNWES
jgi:hypothetical protein